MIQLENKLYTSTEVASILGVSLRSVYRYLDEGSLNAEVKTATGRHRFTKKNILDFLYPDGEPIESESNNTRRTTSNNYTDSNASRNTPNSGRVTNNYNSVNDNSNNDSFSTINSSSMPSSSTAYTNNTDDDDIDWLSKFRAAAEKFKQEDNILENNSEANNQETSISNKTTMNYYRSSLGGLKDIAQSLDKFAKETGIDYAFTLNAGLSLHKPIKPFSVLHAYIRSNDLGRLERLLSLTKTDSSSSQICLITSDNNIIYSNKEIKHSLNVVSKNQLKEDIELYSPDLRDDLYSIL